MAINTKIIGRVLEIFIVVLMVALVVSTIIHWINPYAFVSEAMIKHSEQNYGFCFKTLHWQTKLLFTVLGAIGTAIVFYGLWIGRSIAILLRQRTLLSRQGVEHFVLLKKIVFVWGAFNLFQSGVSFIFFMPKMAMKLKILSFGMMFFSTFIFWGIVALFTAIIRRSAKLQEDQQLTV